MRPSNDEAFILSLESATSIQKPRNLPKVAYHPVSCLLHHYIPNLEIKDYSVSIYGINIFEKMI